MMNKYDYMEAVKEDIKEYIEHEITLSDYADREELESDLQETLFMEDSVTGNASGSYTCNAYQAEENLCHNIDLLVEACEEFGSDIGEVIQSAETCDVIIRCHLLYSALSEVLDDMEEELEDAFAEPEGVEV